MRAQAEALNAIYYPIETSEHLTREEKVPKMVEWYARVNELFIKDKLVRGDVAVAVSAALRDSRVRLRPGFAELLAFCTTYAVPLVVFSAGIGDVLLEVLRQGLGGACPPVMQVVSNFMVFQSANGGAGAAPSADDVLVGWSEPLIQPFNKSSVHLRALESSDRVGYYHDVVRRQNAILVGDSLGDAAMGDGIPHAAKLSFGLLNAGIEALMPQYMATYDAVMTDDAPLTPVLNLLAKVAGGGEPDVEDGGG